MSSAIAIRTQSSDTELVFDINDGNFASFILQVRDPQSPGLLQRLHEALAHLGSETTLVPVEAHPDYMPAHITAHYRAPLSAAINHPQIVAEGVASVYSGSNPGGAAAYPPPHWIRQYSTIVGKTDQDTAETREASQDSLATKKATHEALARGEMRLVKWTKDGTLVDSRWLCNEWGLTRQGLDKARDRGEIFSVRVKGLHYYPAEAAHFARDDLARINHALGNIDAASKLVFLKRKHGALAGGTAAEAVEKGRLMDVLRMAKDWASN